MTLQRLQKFPKIGRDILILADAVDGATLAEICERYHVSGGTVVKAVRRALLRVVSVEKFRSLSTSGTIPEYPCLDKVGLYELRRMRAELRPLVAEYAALINKEKTILPS